MDDLDFLTSQFKRKFQFRAITAREQTAHHTGQDRDRCPKVTSSNLIGYHGSRGHITRASNLLLQFVGAINPSASIT
ncbi:hypothetical protein TIFTF001_030750 [Ficus carica]|uniref:Uncharacterized protein n=1 Tax=Ficus carica TaxID=3494 RepID=A0AA88DU58_FICCA|nr:hypothetical protein TIFTF001_030750 [Ficus carica]